MVLIAIITIASLYFGVQKYRNNDQDNVQIQNNSFKQFNTSNINTFKKRSKKHAIQHCQSNMYSDGVCQPCLTGNSWCTNSQNCCSGVCENNLCIDVPQSSNQFCQSNMYENDICQPCLDAASWCTNPQNCCSGICTDNSCA